jgi:hypothetical protein
LTRFKPVHEDFTGHRSMKHEFACREVSWVQPDGGEDDQETITSTSLTPS